MYNTKYCTVEFIDKENMVFLTWKQFCCGEDYRNPVKVALELLKDRKDSNLLVDARSGFEDDKKDVDWALSEFIPEMAKTDCRKVVFLMNEVYEIEDEMDMWTKEFSKYFQVSKASSYEEAIQELHKIDRVYLNVIYTVKPGKRNEFYHALKEKGIIENSRKETGNLKYEYYFPVDRENEILLLEIWEDTKEQRLHNRTDHYQLLQELKIEYVVDVKIEKYYISR